MKFLEGLGSFHTKIAVQCIWEGCTVLGLPGPRLLVSKASK